jgi:hypothetical protein
MANYANNCRIKLTENINALGYVATLKQTKRIITVVADGETHRIKAAQTSGSYHGDYLNFHNLDNDIKSTNVSIKDYYAICEGLACVCKSPSATAKKEEIAQFIKDLVAKFRGMGLQAEIRRRNDLIVFAKNMRQEQLWMRLSIFPKTIKNKYIIQHNTTRYYEQGSGDMLITDELDIPALINELEAKEPMIFSILHGPYTKEFVDKPLVTKGTLDAVYESMERRVYHGEAIAAKILRVVSLEGHKIVSSAIEPGKNAFFETEITRVNPSSYNMSLDTQRIVTDGNTWGIVLNHSARQSFVLPTSDFDLTLTDKELIGKAIGDHITIEEENDEEES